VDALCGEVELWGLRPLLVPEPVAAEVVLELLPFERLDEDPEEPAEDPVDVGPVLTLADEDGNGADEPQLSTSKATVPLIVMK
jgi:hypothetical protein